MILIHKNLRNIELLARLAKNALHSCRMIYTEVICKIGSERTYLQQRNSQQLQKVINCLCSGQPPRYSGFSFPHELKSIIMLQA